MNLRNSAAIAIVIALVLLGLGACQYSVPITEQPTRQVETNLLGDWVSTDGRESIKIRKLGQSTYIVSYNGVLFQAFHSDLSGISFLIVQELETHDRSYRYLN